MSARFQLIGMGGTFDRFHVGHRSFIRFAHALSKKLVIGVTTASLTTHKVLSTIIEPVEQRMGSVRHFCHTEQIDATIVTLDEPFGPAIEGESGIDGLAVTTATLEGADLLNKKRVELGLSELPVTIHQLLHDEDGNPITSTNIRLGIIDREGRVYEHLFSSTLDINAIPDLRSYLSKAHDQLLTSHRELQISTQTSHPTLVVAVGDFVVNEFIQNDWRFDVGIYDGFSRRQPFPQTAQLEPNITIDNPAGKITNALANAVSTLFAAWASDQSRPSSRLLKVNGEEDLASLAAMLLAPLETVIYYGQPDQGVVRMVVTEDQKHRYAQLLTVK